MTRYQLPGPEKIYYDTTHFNQMLSASEHLIFTRYASFKQIYTAYNLWNKESDSEKKMQLRNTYESDFRHGRRQKLERYIEAWKAVIKSHDIKRWINNIASIFNNPRLKRAILAEMKNCIPSATASTGEIADDRGFDPTAIAAAVRASQESYAAGSELDTVIDDEDYDGPD